MTTTAAAPEPEAPADAADDRGLLARIPFHALLLGAWPALVLWSSNASEVRPAEAWPFVWIPAVVTLVATIALTLVLRRDPRRAALVVSVLAVGTLMGGRVVGVPGRVQVVVAVTVAGAGLLVLARRIAPTTVAAATRIVNVMAFVLVLLTLPAIVPSLSGEGAGAAEVLAADGGSRADIWYLIPDRYPRADTLDDVFDFDNTPFLDGLEARGFDIGTEALANYPKTAHSLASTWNLDYLDDLIDLDAEAAADGSDWGALYALLRDHTLGRTLQAAGYQYTHMGTWWSPTAQSASADRNLRLDARSEFEGVFVTATVWSSFIDVDTTPGATTAEIREGWSDLSFAYTNYQLDTLDDLATQSPSRPRFILAHITQPHEPYVFDRDGSRVTREEAADRTREDNLVRQVENLNRRMTALVDTILANDPDAVIVIQSDEGPHPEARSGPSYDWVEGSDAALREKLQIISAIRLPGGPDLPDDRTSVNTWRWVLNTTIGTDLEILPDRIEVFPGEDSLYTLVDVTARLR